MLIFGHPNIDSPKFIKIDSIDEIKNSNSNDIILIENIKEPFLLPNFLKKNNISYAVYINSIKDAIFSNALNATYAICNLDIAKDIQQIATEYLWDMKILAIINSDEMLEKVALYSIDGVIYENFLKGGNNES